MTIKNLQCYKGLPVKIKSSAPGYWDYEEITSFDGNQSYNITMKEYDGLSYSINQSDLNTISVDFKPSLLPNKQFAEKQTAVLLPYENGKIYHNVNVKEKNTYLKLFGCAVSDMNELSGFSTSNYAQLTKAFPGNFSNFKAIFKVTTGNSLTSHHNCVFGNSGSSNVSVIIRNTGKFSYYTGDWVNGITTLNPNTVYWLCVEYKDSTFTGYILLDNGQYTIDTLPELSEWSTEWTSTKNIFAQNIFNIGYNRNSTSEFFTGTYDLNNCKIWVDGEDFWYYNMFLEVSKDVKGCLYNYTDDGTAATLNCFYYDNSYILSDKNIVTGGLYLGKVNIPAHDVYSYSETPYSVYDNFDVKGSNLNIDQETGKVSGFNSSSYLDTRYIPKLPEKTPWRMRVRFKYTPNATQYYFCAGSYTNGPVIMSNQNNFMEFYITNSGSSTGNVIGTTTLTSGVNYIAEIVYDGDQTYTARYNNEQEGWVTVGTINYDDVIDFRSALIVGSNMSSYYCRGIIDLSTDTWFEINGVKTWIPTTIHYHTLWEKQA